MKKILILMTTIASLLLCGRVFAAGELNLDYTVEQASRVVDVDVSIDGDRGDTAITGLVVNGSDTVVYLVQGYTDRDGKFGFSYINDDGDGDYTLTVSAPRKGLKKSGSFRMLTNSMKALISQTTKDATGMKNIVETYGVYMNLDMTAFNQLTSQDDVYAFMANDPMVDLSDVNTIADGFYGAVIIRKLAEGGNSTDYLNFLNNSTYGILSKKGIPMGTNDTLFDELTPDVKNGVLEKVVGYSYTSAAELSAKLEFFVLEQSIEKALQWTEVNPVMKKFKEAGLLNVDFTSYNNLKQQEVADSALKGKAFDSYTAIENAFNAAVAAQVAEEAKPNQRPTGGGGGGGGGGGAVIPSVTTPEPVEKPSQSTTTVVFDDMENYMWANEAVTYLVEKEIISGTGDNKFEPEKGLTREEISTIMVRTLKLDCEGKKSAFIDVPEDKWSYPYVSAVFEEGLMVGVSNDVFGATSLITRNEFAVIMKRLIDLYGADVLVDANTKDYDDQKEIPNWAVDSVRFLKGAGLMLGSTGNTFAGNEVVSRAYACDILYTVLNAIKYDAEV